MINHPLGIPAVDVVRDSLTCVLEHSEAVSETHEFLGVMEEKADSGV
ncbi:MAG: hypothetical protein ACJASX_001688 [Limisphaerales bacterium]|jgi:hypothetical protein